VERCAIRERNVRIKDEGGEKEKKELFLTLLLGGRGGGGGEKRKNVFLKTREREKKESRP